MKRIKTNVMLILLTICFPSLLLIPVYALATCSGCSTLTAACTAGTTVAQVNTCIGSLPDGGTITFAAGSYAWSGWINLPNTKGVSLIGAGLESSIVTPSGTVIGMNGTLSGDNTKKYRVSGFTFQNVSSGNMTMWFYGAGTLNNIRIDHNAFNNYSTGAKPITFGENGTVGSFYGIIDNNKFTSATNFQALYYLGAFKTMPTSPKGTAKALYFEDNTLTFTQMSNAGEGCMDSWGGAAIVWRHNYSKNCLVTAHGVVHAGGPAYIELSNNTLEVDSGASGFTDGYRLFHHQGSGEFIAFNNIFKSIGTKTGNAMAMTHYRSASPSEAGYSVYDRCDGDSSYDGNWSSTGTYYGYPCFRQPGRTANQLLSPMYVWNNRWSDTGTKIDMVVENPWSGTPTPSIHVVSNRDYYNAVSAAAQTSATSPFNATTGMGYGTMANRPTTCTTNALEAGGGVGYFAMDQGSQGILYRCSSTNTWTTHYTPYTYPHPLRDESRLPAPTLRILNQN